MTEEDPIEENQPEPVDRFRVAPERISQAYAGEVTDHINRQSIAPDDACPVCGHWYNMVTFTPYQITALPQSEAVSSGEVMPVLATVCHNCGFVRLFNRAVVDAAIERHEKGEELVTPPKPSELGGEDGG